MSGAPYELVIGIETHVELKTESMMFCGCQARWFGAPPNTLVCSNRAGVPLHEIVSEPDMSSAEEGEAYVRALRDILIFSGVSEMRLEEGAGRFDVNVSIRFQENGKTQWPPQSEIKNLNSYQALRGAVAYESDRLWEEWRSGGEIRTRTGQITVGWSPERRLAGRIRAARRARPPHRKRKGERVGGEGDLRGDVEGRRRSRGDHEHARARSGQRRGRDRGSRRGGHQSEPRGGSGLQIW